MTKEREMDRVYLKKKLKEHNGMDTTKEDEELLLFFAELGERLYKEGLLNNVFEEREKIVNTVLEKTQFTYVPGSLMSCSALAAICAELFTGLKKKTSSCDYHKTDEKIAVVCAEYCLELVRRECSGLQIIPNLYIDELDTSTWCTNMDREDKKKLYLLVVDFIILLFQRMERFITENNQLYCISITASVSDALLLLDSLGNF